MSNGVMIAFLPTNTEWCRIPDPHMTLVYCGTVDEVSMLQFNDIAKSALTVARFMRPFSLDVTGVEVFGGGEDEKVDVLTLFSTPALLTARKLVEEWNASEHEFVPHATVGLEGSAEGHLPPRLYFDRITAALGPKKLIFPLGESLGY